MLFNDLSHVCQVYHSCFFSFLTLHKSRIILFVNSNKCGKLGSACKFQLVYPTLFIYFFLAKTVLLWILWFAVGGSSVSGSSLVGSCSRYSLSGFGACSTDCQCAVLDSSPFSFNFFFKKRWWWCRCVQWFFSYLRTWIFKWDPLWVFRSKSQRVT